MESHYTIIQKVPPIPYTDSHTFMCLIGAEYIEHKGTDIMCIFYPSNKLGKVVYIDFTQTIMSEYGQNYYILMSVTWPSDYVGKSGHLEWNVTMSDGVMSYYEQQFQLKQEEANPFCSCPDIAIPSVLAPPCQLHKISRSHLQTYTSHKEWRFEQTEDTLLASESYEYTISFPEVSDSSDIEM